MDIQKLLVWVKEHMGSSEPFVHRWCIFLVADGLLSRDFPQVEFALQHFHTCSLCKKRLSDITPLLLEQKLLINKS